MTRRLVALTHARRIASLSENSDQYKQRAGLAAVYTLSETRNEAWHRLVWSLKSRSTQVAPMITASGRKVDLCGHWVISKALREAYVRV